MGKGIFYAVSVGAGDPLDMTLRAKQVLEQADVVVAPVTKQGSASAAYTIAAQAADLSRAQILEMLFPMKAHTDYRERLRSGILQPVCAALDEGKLVAMVTLGDVSVYSTASYVRQLEEKGYETRVAAGVPSFVPAQPRQSRALRKRGDAGNPARVASREVLEQAFDEFDNLVIMKAGRALSWYSFWKNGDFWNTPQCSGMWAWHRNMWAVPRQNRILFYDPADSAERRMTWYILLVQAPETRNC
ncbi:MAG: precorrin-2 C(20)-methyltransferase [Ruminococcus sp.]